jgi:EAL domain-containing protein (putative c-di-GMP-specific phosphodiesterase class I)
LRNNAAFGAVPEPRSPPPPADRASARLQGAVLGALIAPDLEVEAGTQRARAELLRLIETKAFKPVHQPVVELASGAVVGYEALTRWDDGIRPDLRFVDAHSLGIGVEAETAVLVEALRIAPPLPPDTWLSVNASPAFVLSGALEDVLRGEQRTIVVEVTEHDEVADYAKLRAALQRCPNILVAIDDAGAGYASMRHVLDLEPGVIKLDINWVRHVDADVARETLISAMVGFAAKMGPLVIAEGIETVEEYQTLLALGVTYGQGFLFSHPVESADIPVGPLTPHETT